MNQQIQIKIYCMMLFSSLCYAEANLLSLLQQSKTSQSSAKTVTKTGQKFDAFLNQIGKKERNAAYQEALTILNDQALSAAYQENIFHIELILDDYTTQILQKYNQQNQKNQKPVSFIDLLQLIVSKTISSTQSVTQNLSSLLALMQTSSNVNQQSTSHISLVSLVSRSTPQTTQSTTVKSKILQLLNMASSPAKITAAASKNNLLTLLSKSTVSQSDDDQSSNMLDLLSAKVAS